VETVAKETGNEALSSSLGVVSSIILVHGEEKTLNELEQTPCLCTVFHGLKFSLSLWWIILPFRDHHKIKPVSLHR
jgi:hypothetical protein